MEKNKILILMPYFNRPKLVEKALYSVSRAGESYGNWHLVFVDDGSVIPGRPIVENILSDQLSQVTFYQSDMSLDKKMSVGLQLGTYANRGIRENPADIGIILCDDDQLVGNYFVKLNQFYSENLNVHYGHCHIHLTNPLFEKKGFGDGSKYNFDHPINPAGKVDASQVSWRIQSLYDHNVWFGEPEFNPDRPFQYDVDRLFFQNLYKAFGDSIPLNVYGQYKGIHDYQVVWHKKKNKHGILSYLKDCEQKAGEVF